MKALAWHCQTEEDIEESFQTTVAELNKHWDQLVPAYKKNLIKLIGRTGLTNHFSVDIGVIVESWV
jgi:hypothetical protein